jgi:hypothetical protein
MHMRKLPRWLGEVRAHRIARNYTRGEEAVLKALYYSDGPEGRIPSWERLGELSHTSRATAGRAILQARHLGLLVTLPRRKRVGWRYVRSSNRYILSPGREGEVQKNLRLKAVSKPGSSKAQSEPREGKVRKKEATWPEIMAAQGALRRVAASRMETLFGRREETMRTNR